MWKGGRLPGVGTGHIQMPTSQPKGDLLAWRGKRVGRESAKVTAVSTSKRGKRFLPEWEFQGSGGGLCKGELVNSNWTYWPNNGFWFLDLGVLSQEWANGQIRDCILGANFRNVTVFSKGEGKGIRANLQCLRCWGLCSPPLGLLETQCFSFDLKTGFALDNSQRLNAIVELRRWLSPHGACYASIRKHSDLNSDPCHLHKKLGMMVVPTYNPNIGGSKLGGSLELSGQLV